MYGVPQSVTPEYHPAMYNLHPGTLFTNNTVHNSNFICGHPTSSAHQSTSAKTSIHVNPVMCGPRNIYINKAIYTSNSNQSTERKVERVYYNPKFINKQPSILTVSSNMQSTQMSKETKIHINPHFLQKRLNPEVKPLFNENSYCQLKEAQQRTHTRNEIHFNPKFFKDTLSCRASVDRSSVNTDVENVLSWNDATPKQKYNITKYKIIKKKSPGVLMESTNFTRTALKKIIQTPIRKNKYRIVKGQTLSVHNENSKNEKHYLNKYSYKKFSVSSSKPELQFNKNKNNPNLTLKVTLPTLKSSTPHIYKSTYKLVKKKSVLQQKIEARRKGRQASICWPKSYTFKSSKYKFVNSLKNSDVPKPFKSSPKTLYNKHHFHKTTVKLSSDLSNTSIERSSTDFKTISRTKLVRKSILQAQIQSRMSAKKSLQRIATPKSSADRISKYKIVHGSVGIKKATPSSKRINKGKKNGLLFSPNKYRSDKRRKVFVLTKKLRKVNQQCPFYNRYGRCKGKDKGTCPKLHDSRYIAICKKYLKDECKDAECTLSHDIRPEKMPTCHHYLAGLCKRTDCPYLHIKVNQKAPICRSFLQGFCADVHNCTKRHEYICPTFAEKESCLKGKSCSYPHRNPVTYSKLLEPDQFPLIYKKSKRKRPLRQVSIIDETPITLKTKSSEVEEEKSKPNEKSKEFQRYFLTTLTPDEITENIAHQFDEIVE